MFDFPQEGIQQELEKYHQEQGLNAAFNRLYQLAIELTYIEPHLLNDNPQFCYSDTDYGVTFQAQINALRDRYRKEGTQTLKRKSNCPLCLDNLKRPHQRNLRVYAFSLIPQLVPQHDFFVQLTPYPLYPKHFVLVKKRHQPMQMNQQSVMDLLHLVDQAPSYTACSNSDVAWAGSSILEHHHYQLIDQLILPIEQAKTQFKIQRVLCDIPIDLAWLHYPAGCVKLTARQHEVLIHYAAQIIDYWKQLRPKNTCNLMLKKMNFGYQIYILFRHPNHRTPPLIQRIKSEGVGIIEMAGYGIYPVPKGYLAQDIWQEIQDPKRGLEIIISMIQGNSPIKEEHYEAFWQQLNAAISL